MREISVKNVGLKEMMKIGIEVEDLKEKGGRIMLRAELIVKYNAMRDAYIEAGNKLDEVVVKFMELMQDMKEVKDLLKNNGGWGY